MAKKCIMCGEPAQLRIKDSSEFYCDECAELNFGDISMLQKLETDARNLKKYIEHRSKEDDDIKFNIEED